jgi:hypothetical protein
VNILIGIPSSGSVNSSFALDNLPAIIAYTQKNRPDIEIFLGYQCGVRTDRNRNIILQNAIEKGGIDYILWLDEDMLYPHDIIVRYLENEFDVIGCLYFKRSAPFEPVGYIKGTNPIKPYLALDPSGIPKDQDVIEVDALGYGGMMVKMSVYEKMGDNKWTHYGPNYHLPFPCEGKLTHDIQFCKDAQEAGFAIKMHTKVRPGHIGERVVDEEDWKNPNGKELTVTVIMPSTDMEAAQKAAKLMKKRANYPCKILVVEDIDRSGFMATLQKAIDNNPSDFYVYTAQDAFVGNDWLKIAMAKIEETGAGLLALNNGRWGGKMAAFGLVRHSWMVENYGGKLFYPGYQQHYGDVELTLIAKEQNRFAYDPDAVMTEVDFDKDGKGTNAHDKALFNQRKLNGFDGRVKNQELLQFFS